MRFFNWGKAQGDTLQAVGDDIVDNMLPDDLSEIEKSNVVGEVGVKLLLAGASYDERKEIVEQVKKRLGR